MTAILFKRAIFIAWLVISSSANSAGKPNVIYILADDAGIGNFGAYGGKHIATPNIDSLANSGMRFTQHYAGNTVCAPSRSVLLTGMHSGHTRIRHNKDLPLLADDITLGHLFKQAGYATGVIGKWGMGEAGSTGIPNKQGFDYFFGYLNHANAHRYYPEFLWRNSEKVHYKDNHEKREFYSHDLFSDEALRFVERNHAKPFFLYLSFTIPHVDLDVPEDSSKPYLGKFGKDAPAWLTLDYRSHPTPKAALAGMISRMDRDVGRILEQLDELGLRDNTMVMFASDNGPSAEGGAPIDYFNSSAEFRGGKRDFYEGGIRIPFVVSWPATIAPRSVSHHLSGFQDLMPSFAELLQVDAPPGDGISLFPTLVGQGVQEQHDYLYWELMSKFPLNTEKQAVRQGVWKLVRLNKYWLFTVEELYNLERDPQELNDLAAQYPAIVDALGALMDEAHQPDELYPLKYYDE